LSKPPSNDNDNADNDNDEDTVIANASKNHDDRNVVFSWPVAVVVAAVDNGGTRLRRLLLTLTPLHISCQRARRRRGRDPLSSKLRNDNGDNKDDNDDDDKDAVIASASKNDDNHHIVYFAVIGEAAERQQQ
jgi:hypothetical protein